MVDTCTNVNAMETTRFTARVDADTQVRMLRKIPSETLARDIRITPTVEGNIILMGWADTGNAQAVIEHLESFPFLSDVSATVHVDDV